MQHYKVKLHIFMSYLIYIAAIQLNSHIWVCFTWVYTFIQLCVHVDCVGANLVLTMKIGKVIS